MKRSKDTLQAALKTLKAEVGTRVPVPRERQGAGGKLSIGKSVEGYSYSLAHVPRNIGYSFAALRMFLPQFICFAGVRCLWSLQLPLHAKSRT